MAGGALLIQDPALAHTGIDQQAKGQRQVGFFGEVSDGLGVAVLFDGKIVFSQSADELAMLVAHGGEHADHFDVDGDRRGLRLTG